MDQILAQVRAAQRRLWLELFLNRLVRSWFVALAVAVAASAAPKLVALEGLPANWTLWCLAASLGGGFMVVLVWTWLRGRDQLDAAVELDSRFGLRERVSSSLSLTPELAESPAGRALTADALRAVQRVEVAERFPVRLERRGWFPLVSALVAFAIVTLAEDRRAESSIDPHAQEHARAQVDAAAKKLRERMLERRKEAEAKGLKDAEGLFRELEKQTEKLADTKKNDRKQALVKLNDLTRQLEQRRQQVGGAEQMRKQLDQMSGLNRGPADKMVESMKKGDFRSAEREAKQLQEQIDEGKLGDEAQKDLTAQLQQLQEKMAESAAARAEAMENLKQQIAKQQQAGNLEQAGQLQQKLEQLQSIDQQLEMLNKLGQLAGACQQCMKQGDAKGASHALQSMQQQMGQMQQSAAESDMLQAAMEQMQAAKNAMSCGQCNGQGCAACQGGQNSTKPVNNPGTKPSTNYGVGSGPGTRAPETNVQLRDERVEQAPGPGSAVIVGEADGPNLRTQVAEAVTAEMTAAAHEPADPQVLEQLPKSRREHAQEYFQAVGEGS